MLMRTDPFRELDRFANQVLGTAARPAVMPMDAWRQGEEFVVEFDLPGINADSLDIDIERNVVTVRAERPGLDPNREMLATERPRGVFSRQLVLGENLDTEKITASYNEGVLRLRIPVAEKAKPRKISVDRGHRAINDDVARAGRSSTPDQLGWAAAAPAGAWLRPPAPGGEGRAWNTGAFGTRYRDLFSAFSSSACSHRPTPPLCLTAFVDVVDRCSHLPQGGNLR